ncbi:MAG: EamA family transporter, partial [Candidatus Binataceae bacterium]
EKPNRGLVVFSFLAIWLIWGSTYLAIRFAVATIPPLYTVGLRHLTAGSILFAWCLHKRLRPTWAQVRASIVIGAFFFLGGHGTLHWAETRIPSGLASLLIATEPIWVFVLTCAADRKWRMNGLLLAGVAVGLSGVALLLGGDMAVAGHGAKVAAVAVLFGALSWAAGIVYSRRSHLSGHPLLLSALSLLAGSVMLLIVGTIFGEARGFSFSMVSHRSWAALAYLIIFGSVITFTAYNWLLEHYSPTLVATHTYINPVVAVLLGWLLAGEIVSLHTAIAAGLVVGAVILVDRGMAGLDHGKMSHMREATELEPEI